MKIKIKSFLSILALISIIASLSIIFEWGPFAKKEEIKEENLEEKNIPEIKTLKGTVLEKQDDFFILFTEDNSEPIKIEVFQDTPFILSHNFEGNKDLQEKFESEKIPVDELAQRVGYELLSVGDNIEFFFRLENDKRKIYQVSIIR